MNSESAGNQAHWEHVYQSRPTTDVSWYREHLEISLQMIVKTCPDTSSPIIDIGGGSSTLIDDLLQMGYRNVSVLDISNTALENARKRLGASALQAHWIAGDILSVMLQDSSYDLWHDRAVFHFLTEPAQRAAYIESATRTIRHDGFVVLATFASDGPAKCSGLPVQRYEPEQLAAMFGQFRLLESRREQHGTPSGGIQSFVYVLMQKV
jgi:2-polyprenyl-3-methyl-5-hydroxy-6-metoxy-1,4-benzoquinol methylase